MKASSKSADDLLSSYQAAGWCVANGVLGADALHRTLGFLNSRVAQLTGAFAEWLAAHGGNPQDSYLTHQTKIEQYEALGLPKDYWHFLKGEFDLPTRLDQQFVQLLASESCKRFLCSFLRTDRYLVHYPPMLRFKQPGARVSEVPVHQDAAYNSHLSDFVTLWVPLVDIDDACGGVIVYEGSQAVPLQKHESAGPWSNRATVDVSAFQRRHILMRAGDFLMFSPHLLHESAPNNSARLRFSIDFRLFRESHQTRKSFYDPFRDTITRID